MIRKDDFPQCDRGGGGRFWVKFAWRHLWTAPYMIYEFSLPDWEVLLARCRALQGVKISLPILESRSRDCCVARSNCLTRFGLFPKNKTRCYRLLLSTFLDAKILFCFVCCTQRSISVQVRLFASKRKEGSSTLSNKNIKTKSIVSALDNTK